MLGAKLLEILVVGRPGERVDLCYGFGQLVPGHQVEHCPAHTGVRRLVIQQYGADFGESQSGGIKVADRSEPVFLTCGFGIGEHARDDHIEQVEHVVMGVRFQRTREGQQGGDAAIIGKAFNGLGFRRGGKAGQRGDPGLRQSINGWKTARQCLRLLQSLHGPPQLGGAVQNGAIAQSVERAHPLVFRDHDQGFQACPLLRRNGAGQPLPKSLVGAAAHPGNGAFEHG